MSDLSILIPAAGIGRRMKSYGPKALIELFTHETILARQLSILRTIYPLADIVVVTGFESDKMFRHIPKDVRVVENEFFETTNVARSICMGLRAITTKNVLLVYGDTVFEEKTISKLCTGASKLVASHTHKKDEIGLVHDIGVVENLSYISDTTWGHIAFLAQPELDILRRVVYNRNKSMCLGFEVLNDVIDLGGKFEIAFSGFAVDIDSYSDLAYTKELTKHARTLSRVH